MSKLPKHLEGYDWKANLTDWKVHGPARVWEVSMISSEARPGLEMWEVNLKWFKTVDRVRVRSHLSVLAATLEEATYKVIEHFREATK